jgi:phosphatidylserine/phosphatidylglycerophosphate/cardiolipin synthase-like enzyme
MKRLLASAGLVALTIAAPACTKEEGPETAESDYSALSEKPYEGTCTPGARVCAYFSPTDMPSHAVIAAMKSAQHSIRIATYNINIPEIADVLRRRLDEGVKVELMEDFAHAIEDEPDAKSVWMRLGDHPNLTKYKTPVLRGGNPQMHNKILVVDNERVFFGSANWTFTGLVGNFENVMSIRDPATVAKFVAELDELEALSQTACETFGTPTSSCGKGTEKFSPEFQHLALEGSLLAAPAGPIDKTKPGCASLLDGSGLFIAGNQPRIADAAVLKACFVDPALGDKYATFAARIAGQEKYVDGTQVSADPMVIEHITPASGRAFDAVTFKHRDTQTGPIRAYFSGEDDVEYQMLRELRAAEENPTDSFAYLSTNFLTNGRLVKQVAKLKDLGVHTRVFFDRGRFEDPNFSSQFFALSKLGFTYGLGSNRVKVEQGPSENGRSKWNITRLPEIETEATLAQNVVSVFNNDLSGNFGANHNKFAVIGHKGADGKFRVTLMNGSANWSGGAMQEKEENFVVLEDEHAASIYLREMISQMYGFRYGQDENSVGLKEDMAFVAARVPCFEAVMGRANDACKDTNGAPWKPAVSGALIMAVKNVPAALDGSRRDWAWVANWQPPTDGAPAGRAFELYSAETFEGKWVTSIPYAPSSELQYKFFTAPPNVDPNRDGLGAGGIEWEYGGMGNDRRATLGSRPLLTIRSSNLQWGAP